MKNGLLEIGVVQLNFIDTNHDYTRVKKITKWEIKDTNLGDKNKDNYVSILNIISTHKIDINHWQSVEVLNNIKQEILSSFVLFFLLQI